MLRLYQASTTRWAYDGTTMIAEYNSSSALLRRFVHGPGIDEPLVWYEGTGTSDRRFLHADERGSIIAISDGAGAVLGTNRYDEYGVPESPVVGRFQYTGQAYISSLGLYYYRARFYNPALGRFMQTDPIGYGGGMNMYAYVSGDPTNLTDPTGLSEEEDSPPPDCINDPCRPSTPGELCTTCLAYSIPGPSGSWTRWTLIYTKTKEFYGYKFVPNPFGSAALWTAQFGPGLHAFVVINAVATTDQCTAEEAQQGLRRNGVPDQDPGRPVTSTPQEYPIYLPGTSLEVGRVSSQVMRNGLIRNTTLLGHPFYYGTVDRGIAAVGPFWVVGTRGHGVNHNGLGAALINQFFGPKIFQQLDARLSADLAASC